MTLLIYSEQYSSSSNKQITIAFFLLIVQKSYYINEDGYAIKEALMGIMRSTGKILGFFINVRADKWVNLSGHVSNVKLISNQVKDLFSIEQADRKETFEEAVKRLELNEDHIKSLKYIFSFYTFTFLFISLLLFVYAMCLAIYLKNWMGTVMAFSLMLFSLTNAFRYNFWLFQLKQKRLSCTFRDWLNS